MTHLNIVSFICLIIFIYYIKVLLDKPEKLRNRLLNVQLAIVLGYNIFIIIVFPYKVPVEFSTISYFVVPFIALLNIKELKIWGAYSALLAGVGYYFSMIVNGNGLYSDFPVYSIITSLFNHGSLLAYAIVSIATMNITKNDKYVLIGGLAFNCSWALIIRPLVLHPGRIFIYEILDANLIRYFLPNYLYIGIPLYFFVVFYLVYLSMKLVYWTNKKFQLKHQNLQTNKQYNPA